jgi:hypothetical protein
LYVDEKYYIYDGPFTIAEFAMQEKVVQPGIPDNSKANPLERHGCA